MTTPTPPTPKPTDPTSPEPRVLEYRPRAVNPAPPVGPSEWLKASVALGGLSWLTIVLLCAGAASPLAWIPVGLAIAGMVTGFVAAIQPLPRESSAGALFALFMGFLVLAIWLLALVLF
jgi:hypothetical protein